MAASLREIVENFPELLKLGRGSGDSALKDIQAASTATPESLVFVSSPKHLKEMSASRAQTWVVSKDLLEKVPPSVKNVVVAANVQLAMSFVAKKFFPQTEHHMIVGDTKVHPQAHIAASAKIGAGSIVAPGAVIGERAEIGENCVIGANTVIENGVKIGPRSHIHPLVFIAHDCEIGADCEIKPNTTIGGEGFGYAQDAQFNHHRLTHYGRVIIEDRVHIGAGVQIDRGTFEDSRIGSGTKIDNHCHFGHNIRIGNNTLITGGMITAGSATLGSYCVFGGRTTIAGHLTIADRCHFGGISMIHSSVTEPGQYAGFPLEPLKDAMRTRAATPQLPKLVKQVRRIMKHLGLEEPAKNED